MTAVALTKPAREIDALEAIQAARYVEGRDVTAHAVLTDILGDLELEQAATRFAAPDTALRTACEARTAEARRALQALGATGDPNGLPRSSRARRPDYGRGDLGQRTEEAKTSKVLSVAQQSTGARAIIHLLGAARNA